MPLKHKIAALLMLLCVSQLASAATCTVTVTALAFGLYDPELVGPDDTLGLVTLDCTALVVETVNYDIEMSTGGAGSFTPRQMSNGGDTLNYNIYTDLGRTQIWGDGSGSTSTLSDSLLVVVLGSSAVHTSYGRVVPGQLVEAGAYSDTVLVTVTY